jgi:hypothetical protein
MSSLSSDIMDSDPYNSNLHFVRLYVMPQKKAISIAFWHY